MSNNGTNDARELEILAIQSMMSTEGGRDFAYRILEQCGFMSDAFDPVAVVHARNTGAQGVGLWLQRELMEANLDNYLKMIKEHVDNE